MSHVLTGRTYRDRKGWWWQVQCLNLVECYSWVRPGKPLRECDMCGEKGENLLSVEEFRRLEGTCPRCGSDHLDVTSHDDFPAVRRLWCVAEDCRNEHVILTDLDAVAEYTHGHSQEEDRQEA